MWASTHRADEEVVAALPPRPSAVAEEVVAAALPPRSSTAATLLDEAQQRRNLPAIQGWIIQGWLQRRGD